MRKALCIITAGIFMATALSGCSLTQKLGFGNKDDSKAASSTSLSEEESKKLDGKMPVNLYFGSSDNTKLMLEVRHINASEGKKGTASLATAIVNELINGPQEKDLKATIPQGTKLAGPVAVQSGTATVNLTKEFVDKHPGGSAAAKLTIYSIVNSLTELNDIQRVKFLVNGKTVSDFKGAYKFDAAFPRTVSLIGKTSSAEAASTAAKVNVSTKTNTQTSTQTSTQNNVQTKTQTAAQKSTTTSNTQSTKKSNATTPPKATIAPSSKPTTVQPATTPAQVTSTPATATNPVATPSPTPKKSSLVVPQSKNLNSLSSQLAYIENID